MRWIENLKTSVKLLLAFGVVILLLAVTAGAGMNSASWAKRWIKWWITCRKRRRQQRQSPITT